MNLKAVKFGGSSLADAACFRSAAELVRADPARRYVVVSAPGKRNAEDVKITDLLLKSLQPDESRDWIELAADRFREIIRDLGLELSIEDDIQRMKQAAAAGKRDYLASRGEYLSGRIMAALLGYDFVDPAAGIVFDRFRQCSWERSRCGLAAALRHTARAVIPGFYGADEAGNICTFLRGGSDVTGALVAAAVNADFYENWTDVSGVLTADPRVVSSPRPIAVLSYDELRSLSHNGAQVMHEDAVIPVREKNIPILIKNTRRPWDIGTMVTAGGCETQDGLAAVCSRRNISRLFVSWNGKREEMKIRNAVQTIPGCQLLPEDAGVTVLVDASESAACEQRLACLGYAVSSRQNLSLISLVGRAGSHCAAMRKHLMDALRETGISVDIVHSDADSVCAAVSTFQERQAVQAIYRKLFPQTAA